MAERRMVKLSQYFIKKGGTCRSSLFTLLAGITLAGCSEGIERYEQVGGDPNVDFIEFVNDSTVHFMAPGMISTNSKYTEEKGEITIFIAPMVQARLHRLDSKTLQGEVPFFEGKWIRK